MNLQATSRHLGKIENLIYEVSKMIRGCFDALDWSDLSSIQCTIYPIAK